MKNQSKEPEKTPENKVKPEEIMLAKLRRRQLSLNREIQARESLLYIIQQERIGLQNQKAALDEAINELTAKPESGKV